MFLCCLDMGAKDRFESGGEAMMVALVWIDVLFFILFFFLIGCGMVSYDLDDGNEGFVWHHVWNMENRGGIWMYEV